MYLTVSEQAKAFLFISLLGYFFGILYDFSKSVKKEYSLNKLYSSIFDIIFFSVSFFTAFILIFSFNGFELRFYYLIGFIFGFIIYFGTISKYILIFFKGFLKFFNKILKILLYPVKKLCIIVNIIFNLFKKLGKKFYLKFILPIKFFVEKIKRRRKKV